MAVAASLMLHALTLTAAAWTVHVTLRERILEVRHTPFAGERVAIAMSIATPDVKVPPPPDTPPIDSPVVVTPVEARLEKHVYVDKRSADVAFEATTTLAPVEVAEVAKPKQKLGERETQTTKTQQQSPSASTTAVARAIREIAPTTAMVTVPPQTLGTNARRAAKMHNNRPPRYPDIARQNGWEGTVLLKLSIDSTGRVTHVAVARSSGYAILDAAATAAVRTWQGEPATEGGVAVASEESLPVRFRLR